MMTLTQWGLLADILGVALLLPSLTFAKVGIPWHPKVGTRSWWRLLTGALLVVGGFGLQFAGTF